MPSARSLWTAGPGCRRVCRRLAVGGMVDVDPQDRAEPVVGVLAGRQGIVGGAAVAQRDVEVAVRPEGDVPPLWFSNGSSAETQIRSSLAGIGLARDRRFETAKPRDDRMPACPPFIGRIIDEELPVLLVFGVERQAQQTLLVPSVDRVGELEEQLLVVRFAAGWETTRSWPGAARRRTGGCCRRRDKPARPGGRTGGSGRRSWVRCPGSVWVRFFWFAT